MPTAPKPVEKPAAMVPKQVRTYNAKTATPEAETWLKANQKGNKKNVDHIPDLREYNYKLVYMTYLTS